MLYVNPGLLRECGHVEWGNFVGGLFNHFVAEKVCQETWGGLHRGQRQFVYLMDHPAEVIAWTPEVAMQQMAGRFRRSLEAARG